YSDNLVAAWGGVGNLFGQSTYPQDIKGNTLAMVHNAGGKLVDIEFLEYEPMVVLSPEGAVGEPCPTAMLGEGAHLLNTKGDRFMLEVRPEGEAGSSKTLINKQIWKEVDKGFGTEHRGVLVDLRHINRNVLKAYPWFFDRLMANGVDPNEELVEVGPMAHSFSGGIWIDENYQSNLEGFFAVGEACGGVHGACRCAGNAASQATLSGLLCAEAINKLGITSQTEEMPIDFKVDTAVYEKYVPKARAIAIDALGIYRHGDKLKKASEDYAEILKNEDIANDTQCKQMVESMALMVKSALEREESRGTHMRLDFPEEREEFKKKIIQ
ncbi:MAG: FAD-binding protein, partial [Anaerotignaceae bacterium]